MPRIRILQGVSGDGFSWIAGDEVDLPEEEATKWADGYRAERLSPASKAPAPTPETDDAAGDESVEDEAPAGAEKATPRSRGGGRARRTETR